MRTEWTPEQVAGTEEEATASFRRRYQRARDELRRLEARDCLDRLEMMQAARKVQEDEHRAEMLRRVWMIRS